MVADWRALIVEMTMAKQALATWDPDGRFPNRFPSAAATEAAIAAAEDTLGVMLDEEHIAFLACADERTKRLATVLSDAHH